MSMLQSLDFRRPETKRQDTTRKTLAVQYRGVSSGTDEARLKGANGSYQAYAADKPISLPRLPGFYGSDEPMTYHPRSQTLHLGGQVLNPNRRR